MKEGRYWELTAEQLEEDFYLKQKHRPQLTFLMYVEEVEFDCGALNPANVLKVIRRVYNIV